MLEAFGVVFTFDVVLMLALGTAWGLVFGMIPGLSATLAVVVLIPVTYGMDPIHGICMLIAVYIGGVSGGLVSAVLVGMPGTPSSITTAFDGFPLAKQGLGRKALGVGAISNLIGSFIGWIFLITLAPEIADLALGFGPFEYVAIILFGMTAVVSLSGGSMSKGFAMAAFGLFLATVGMDPTYGASRNTFGLSVFSSGVSTIPAMIGLFVLSQVYSEVLDIDQKYTLPESKPVKHIMTKAEWKESIPNFLRSGLIGTFIGILPGIGGNLANFVTYDQAKKRSKDPDSFGQGNIQGIIASETANNAVIGGALIPMLALGIPGDAATAALLGGLQIHNLTPGPLLIKENPTLVYSVFIAFMVAVVIMFLMMLGGSRVFPRLLRIRKSYLLPAIMVAAIVGCYNLQYSTKDIWMAVIFGFVGYVLLKYKYPLTPVVIGLILGGKFEQQLRLGITQSDGSLLPFLTRPISLFFLLAAVASIVVAVRMNMKENKKENNV